MAANQVDREVWNCPICTFENHILLPHCEMCGYSKSTIPKSDNNRNINDVNDEPIYILQTMNNHVIVDQPYNNCQPVYIISINGLTTSMNIHFVNKT